MIDARTEAVLQAALARECRSFLQYLGDSFPWPNANEQHREIQLEAIVDQERAATADLGRFMVRHKVLLPYLGSFPTAFTSWNFTSLYHLTARLVVEQQEAVAALERDLSATGHAGVRAALTSLLDVKRRHLQMLEGFSQQPPSPGALAS